jgi:hypothetical protein
MFYVHALNACHITCVRKYAGKRSFLQNSLQVLLSSSQHTVQPLRILPASMFKAAAMWSTQGREGVRIG